MFVSTIMQWILVHPYTIWKKCVFNLEINISTVLDIRMSSGKSFHALTVAMLNARSPYVMSFVLDSSKRRGSSDDRRPSRYTLASGSISLIYDGPVPLRALYAIRRHLKMTRFLMGSQCNSFIAPVTWSNFLKSVTNFAAAFWASWSRLRTYCGIPVRRELLSSLEITWACTTVFVWSWVRYSLIF